MYSPNRRGHRWKTLQRSASWQGDHKTSWTGRSRRASTAETSPGGEEQAQIRARIERHEKADQNYIDQGIRLLEIARNAQEVFRSHGRAERAALLRFIMPASALRDDRVIPSFTPPFDIIHRMALETRACAVSKHDHKCIKKQADGDPTACPILLPRPDSNGRPGR
jgi:hypothetical protein